MAMKNLPLTERQKEQLQSLGFKEDEIDNETLIDVTLYKEALKGNVTALNMIKKMQSEEEEEPIDDNHDITQEVATEEESLLNNLSSLSKTQLEVNAQLIHNVAFLSVELKHLADDIAKNGVKEKYKNGANQWGFKDRAEVKTYNAMIKNYQSCMKQLNELMNGYFGEEDEFDAFNEQY